MPKSLKLSINGQGHITSFKNSKMICRGRLMTNPKKQKQMEAYTRSIESQLRSAYQTTAAETQTVRSLASWIRSSVPLDDSIQWMPEIGVLVRRVAKGDEGADIEITPLL